MQFLINFLLKQIYHIWHLQIINLYLKLNLCKKLKSNLKICYNLCWRKYILGISTSIIFINIKNYAYIMKDRASLLSVNIGLRLQINDVYWYFKDLSPGKSWTPQPKAND